MVVNREITTDTYKMGKFEGAFGLKHKVPVCKAPLLILSCVLQVF